MKFKHRTNCSVGLSVYKSHCRQIAGHRSLDLLLESGGAQHTCWLAGPVTGAAVWMAILVLLHPPPLPNLSAHHNYYNFTGQGEAEGGQAGGPGPVGGPAEEGAGSQLGGAWAPRRASPGWSGAAPGWEGDMVGAWQGGRACRRWWVGVSAAGSGGWQGVGGRRASGAGCPEVAAERRKWRWSAGGCRTGSEGEET